MVWRSITILFLLSLLSAKLTHADELESILQEIGVDPSAEITVTEKPDVADAIVTDVVASPGAAANNTEEPVSVSQLILIGKGMANGHSTESLALTCTDASCSTLRFVHFLDQNRAFYMGNPIVIANSLSQKQLRKNGSPGKQRKVVVKDLFRNFKRWRRDQKGLSKDTRYAITYVAFMISAFGPTLLSGLSAPTLGLSLAVYPFYLVLTPMITGDIKVFSGAQRTSKATLDQNGWNWEDQPTRLRHKTFNYLLEYFGS